MGKRDTEFEFGPLSRGIFQAMIALAVLMPLYFPEYTMRYVLLVLVVGLGLRPVLLATGLHVYWDRLEAPLHKRWSERELKKHRQKLELKARQDALKKKRYRGDTRLPKNW